MGSISPALITLFNNVVARTSDLFVWRIYTITLFGGGVLRFADADFDIKAVASTGPLNVAGQTYPASTVRIDERQSKTQAHWKIGLDTDQYTLVVMPRPVDLVTGEAFPDTIGGVPWLRAAQSGALDAADFQVDECYFDTLPAWPIPPGGASPLGCRTLFAGTIAEVDTTNAIAVLTVNDYRSLLSYNMPRHYYEAQCRHTLFDVGCTLNAANYGVNGAVGAGSTASSIFAPGLARPQGSGTYTLGRIVFTSGYNATFQRTIKSWDGSFTLSMLNPLPFPPAADDTFTVYPGCNKLLSTCGAFGNTINYGGQPFIPQPEVVAGG
jgi:Phage conserved hypothetical protein BR0599/Uncharacterized conserved protein (DUF2163)